jgi:hypothetical protein
MDSFGPVPESPAQLKKKAFQDLILPEEPPQIEVNILVQLLVGFSVQSGPKMEPKTAPKLNKKMIKLWIRF